MSFFRKMFGLSPARPKAPKAVETIMYDGYKIATMPMKENGQFRLCALLTKEVDGVEKTHKIIRADVFSNEKEASNEAIRKAKQVIAEQGEDILR